MYKHLAVRTPPPPAAHQTEEEGGVGGGDLFLLDLHARMQSYILIRQQWQERVYWAVLAPSALEQQQHLTQRERVAHIRLVYIGDLGFLCGGSIGMLKIVKANGIHAFAICI
jgi:hypothetical protein